MAGQHKAANIVHFSRLSEEGYRWLREDKAGWRSEGEALHIAALPGSLWEDSNNARNILIRSEGLAGAVRLEVEVTLAPERNSEQAGLLLYADDDNYIKLVKELVNDEHVVVLAVEVQGATRVLSLVKMATDARTIRLQLDWSGNEAAARFLESEDGIWTEMGRYAGLEAGAFKPGLCSHGGGETPARWAAFTGLQLTDL